MVQAVLQSSQAQGIPPEALRGRGHVGDQERLLSGMLGAALLVGGLRHGGVSGITSMALGGALIGRGATGYCPFYASFRENPAERQVAEELGWKHAAAVSRSITVQKPRSEVYRFWRDLRNLPRFMHNIASVTAITNGKSHWIARGPVGQKQEWDCEITEDVPNSRISWRTTGGAAYNQSGTVTFKDAPGNRGTEVTLMLAYEPPYGQVGRVLAQLFRQSPTQGLREDLSHFKQIMETGEIATPAVNKEQQHRVEG